MKNYPIHLLGKRQFFATREIIGWKFVVSSWSGHIWNVDGAFLGFADDFGDIAIVSMER